MSVLEKLFKKDKIGIVSFNDDKHIQNILSYIIESNCGFLHLKCNDVRMLLINGLSEEDFTDMVKKHDIKHSLYKNTDNFLEFKSDIEKLSNISESKVTLYEREVGGFFTAILNHGKNEKYKWFKI